MTVILPVALIIGLFTLSSIPVNADTAKKLNAVTLMANNRSVAKKELYDSGKQQGKSEGKYISKSFRKEHNIFEYAEICW